MSAPKPPLLERVVVALLVFVIMGFLSSCCLCGAPAYVILAPLALIASFLACGVAGEHLLSAERRWRLVGIALLAASLSSIVGVAAWFVWVARMNADDATRLIDRNFHHPLFDHFVE